MRVLVVGGAGYIGSMLVPRLLELGHRVEVLDLLWFGNHLPGSVPVSQRCVMSLERKDLEGYDQVVFLAGLSNDPMADFAPALNFVANAAAPAFLAHLAKAAGVKRFVYASSCSVYGDTGSRLEDESADVAPRYGYALSKLQGETACLMLQDATFSVLALRMGTVCGYSPRMRFDLVLNTMVRSSLKDGLVTVRNPHTWRPILSIRDAADAFANCVEADAELSGVFNVASGNFSVLELGQRVQDKVQSFSATAVRLELLALEEPRSYRVNTERAATNLGFVPSRGIEDIVADVLAHANEFGDFGDSRFYNIKRLTELVEEGQIGMAEVAV